MRRCGGVGICSAFRHAIERRRASGTIAASKSPARRNVELEAMLSVELLETHFREVEEDIQETQED